LTKLVSTNLDLGDDEEQTYFVIIYINGVMFCMFNNFADQCYNTSQNAATMCP
jgi:hypothetical protein